MIAWFYPELSVGVLVHYPAVLGWCASTSSHYVSFMGLESEQLYLGERTFLIPARDTQLYSLYQVKNK